jgi:putative DNA primase/helicase
MQFAKAEAKRLFVEAFDLTDKKDQEVWVKHALGSENVTRLEATAKVARSEPGMAIEADHLDADPYLLNVSNGTVDLRSGSLIPHDPAHLITKAAHVAFDADARSPLWDAFISEVLPDPEVATYVQRAIGLSLLGAVQENALFILYGPGLNGKTTLTEVVMYMLGDYAASCSTDVLLDAQGHPRRSPHSRGGA